MSKALVLNETDKKNRIFSSPGRSPEELMHYPRRRRRRRRQRQRRRRRRRQRPHLR